MSAHSKRRNPLCTRLPISCDKNSFTKQVQKQRPEIGVMQQRPPQLQISRRTPQSGNLPSTQACIMLPIRHTIKIRVRTEPITRWEGMRDLGSSYRTRVGKANTKKRRMSSQLRMPQVQRQRGRTRSPRHRERRTSTSKHLTLQPSYP